MERGLHRMLTHHRHRDPGLLGLRHDLTLLRLAPPPTKATDRSAARRDRLLLDNRHQLSVHLSRSGHLQSTHFPSAQPDKTPPIRTGGLRQRVTENTCLSSSFRLVVGSPPTTHADTKPSRHPGTIGDTCGRESGAQSRPPAYTGTNRRYGCRWGRKASSSSRGQSPQPSRQSMVSRLLIRMQATRWPASISTRD